MSTLGETETCTAGMKTDGLNTMTGTGIGSIPVRWTPGVAKWKKRVRSGAIRLHGRKLWRSEEGATRPLGRRLWQSEGVAIRPLGRKLWQPGGAVNWPLGLGRQREPRGAAN